MCDLVFLNRSEQPLDCGTASSFTMFRKDRVPISPAVPLPALSLFYTGTDGNLQKAPKNLFVVSVSGDEKEQRQVRVTLNTKEGYGSLDIRGLKTQPHTSVPPHSATKSPAAHTQSLACCCSGTRVEEEPCVGWKRESQGTTVFSVIRGKWNHRLTGIPVTVDPSSN